MQVVGAIVAFAMSREKLTPEAAVVVLVTLLVLAAIFFGLWLWAKKSPFAALLTTLIIFVTFHLLEAVIDPTTLFQGIILKIAFVVGLSTALQKAYTKKRYAELDAAQS